MQIIGPNAGFIGEMFAWHEANVKDVELSELEPLIRRRVLPTFRDDDGIVCAVYLRQFW